MAALTCIYADPQTCHLKAINHDDRSFRKAAENTKKADSIGCLMLIEPADEGPDWTSSRGIIQPKKGQIWTQQ